MIMRAFNPSTQKAEVGGSFQFQTSRGYIVRPFLFFLSFFLSFIHSFLLRQDFSVALKPVELTL